jgi:galactokinase
LAPYLPEARALSDVEIADLEEHKHALPRTVYRCCRHVGSENQRVFAAAKELRSQGRPVWSFDVAPACATTTRWAAMNSLFWTTWPLRVPAYGACMTGDGFGRYTGSLPVLIAPLRSRPTLRTYEEATGISPDSYVCERTQGAQAWPVREER